MSQDVLEGSSKSLNHRLRLNLDGVVQGTGFRPFVYRLALALELGGWVENTDDGVTIEIEGPRLRLETFRTRLLREAPRASAFASIETSATSPIGQVQFAIRPSTSTGARVAHVAPDLATCNECLKELNDPSDHRYRYPFINCTACGPRYSILLGLPWDRPRTTMRRFEMCGRCRREFEDPSDRRFHAQPTACPDCGPHLALLDSEGCPLGFRENALSIAATAIQEGKIAAIKGIGGFHLFVDARDSSAVSRLRRRKQRDEKPFAVMYPSLAHAEQDCEIGPGEADLLGSTEAPIVLLRQRRSALAASVTASSSEIGALLPYTPLHHLLMKTLGFPVVATSGNHSGEPLCTDEGQAVSRLGTIADVLLIHNRAIAHPLDDSVVRIVSGSKQILRRGRGYAPMSVPIAGLDDNWLALGGHLKNTIAIGTRSHAFLSPHIGDLDSAETFALFRRSVGELENLSHTEVGKVAVDAHPDYLSARHAETLDVPVTRIQHHYAHVRSCMVDNALEAPLLGVAWDGGGSGVDGSVWGGEFIDVEQDRWTRIAHLKTFPLPGGEYAIREPWRIALGLMEKAGVSTDRLRVPESVAPLEKRQQLEALIRAHTVEVPTSSVGRLFDAVASIAGIRHRVSFEGQAAMELEGAMGSLRTRESYELDLMGRAPIVIDWRPMIRQLTDDVEIGVDRNLIACRFHNALVEALVSVAVRVGRERVVLTGGCFQNRFLTEAAVEKLGHAGFRPFWHHRVPPNDGGLAVGQLAAVAGVRTED